MNRLQLKEPVAPALSTIITDEESGLRGWIVVDNLSGRAIDRRYAHDPGVNDKEFVALARTMTYKLALVD